MFVNRIKIIAFILSSLFCVAATANEIPGSIMAGVPVEQTIYQMLKIDADRALWTEKKMLAEAQSRLGGPQIKNGPLSAAGIPNETINHEKPLEPIKPIIIPVKMEVLGIFGLGENLLADVIIDNARVRFKRGHAIPLGAGSEYPYRLISINVPCVKISDANKIEHSICLNKSPL